LYCLVGDRQDQSVDMTFLMHAIYICSYSYDINADYFLW
jgi:hypothetical protein